MYKLTGYLFSLGCILRLLFVAIFVQFVNNYFRYSKMKATKNVCSLILMMFITISELKIQKFVVDDKEMTIETEDKTADFLTRTRQTTDNRQHQQHSDL